MSREKIEALIDIVDQYALPSGNFIWIFSADKHMHDLLNFALDILVMQEVAYHILTALTARLYRKKKEP